MWITHAALEIAERHRQECEARVAAHRILVTRMEVAGQSGWLREARLLLNLLTRLRDDADDRVAALKRELDADGARQSQAKGEFAHH